MSGLNARLVESNKPVREFSSALAMFKDENPTYKTMSSKAVQTSEETKSMFKEVKVRFEDV